MQNSNRDLVIGVDGGGTKTLAWVSPRDDVSNSVVLGRGQAGPGNPRAVGFNAAQQSIANAVSSALTVAGRKPGPVSAICMGIAGAGRADEQAQIEQWARNAKLADRIRVCGDAEPILAAGSQSHTGVALIAGTGSLAWGRNAEGTIARAGGWGYLFGDEGGAYWIALAALRAAAQAADHRRPVNTLLLALMKELDADDPSQLIGIIYSSDMTRDGLASLAKVVFDHASDPVAAGILQDAARELAAMVESVCRQLGLTSGYSLAITGSVLLNQTAYVEQLTASLRERGADPGQIQTVTNPVRGAMALARRILR